MYNAPQPRPEDLPMRRSGPPQPQTASKLPAAKAAAASAGAMSTTCTFETSMPRCSATFRKPKCGAVPMGRPTFFPSSSFALSRVISRSARTTQLSFSA